MLLMLGEAEVTKGAVELKASDKRVLEFIAKAETAAKKKVKITSAKKIFLNFIKRIKVLAVVIILHFVIRSKF